MQFQYVKQESLFRTPTWTKVADAAWYATNGGETRYTLGRNCTRLRAQLGLTDESADGASGRVSLATIDSAHTVTTVYTSPALVPGATAAGDRPLTARRTGSRSVANR